MVNRPGVTLTTHPSSAEIKQSVELYLYSPFGLSWPVLGELLIQNGSSRSGRERHGRD